MNRIKRATLVPDDASFCAHSRTLRVVAALAGLLVGAVGAARAQQESPARLLLAARQVYLDESNTDSALVLVDRVLRANPSPRERAWAFALRAVLRLERQELVAARQDFVRAYQTDARMVADSFRTLSDLQSEVGAVLGQARLEYQAQAQPTEAAPPRPQPAAPLTVTPVVPGDTTIPARDGRLVLGATTSRPARVVLRLTPADVEGQLLWADTLQRGVTRSAGWDLRTPDGAILPNGRYALHVVAVDTTGEESPRIQRIVRIERIAADTQPWPPPPVYENATVQLPRGSPAVLLAGAAFGAAAALLPSALAQPDINAGRSGDGTAYVVAGAVAVSGVVGYLRGHRERLVPEIERRNLDRRNAWNAQVAGITRANADARANAAIHVVREGGGP